MIIPIGKAKTDIALQLNKLNRHGLITGATGTGKTVTLKVMAEQMSKAGIPVFLADIKGDLASLTQAGEMNDNIASRLQKLEITDYENQRYPVALWDVFGESGTPVRANITEMGPLLLGRLLGLNDTQSGVLNIVFKIASDHNWLLIDLKDLKAILQEVGNNAGQYTTEYGNVTKQSIGAIQRNLLVLEQQGGNQFFGEPSIKLTDFMTTDASGKGMINILMAKELFHSPLLYSTFLLWMLNELFAVLPEVGDPDKPKLVFFFDEAHLLFNNAPKAFVEQVEQVVRLIRSKGVGVFFITQNPLDLPENILGQLGNRVQHALRAYTPKEQKAIKAAAETFRQNPDIDVASAITDLKVGEALLSFLNQEGQPTMVERAFIRPPESYMGTIDPLLLAQTISANPFERLYREAIDRESAHEILMKKLEAQRAKEEEILKVKEREQLQKTEAKAERERERARKNNPTNKVVDTVIRQVTREVTRTLMNFLKRK